MDTVDSSVEESILQDAETTDNPDRRGRHRAAFYIDAAFSYNNREDTDNIRNRPETGGSGIRDIGVYTYGSVRFVTGAEPQELTSKIRRENGVDVWSPDLLGHAGASGPLHLFGHDLDADAQSAGGRLPRRQGHDPRRQCALQRRGP